MSTSTTSIDGARRSRPSGDTVAAFDRSQLRVITTKLQPPFARPGIVDRPRLTAAARQAMTPVVALVGPAGYGKTTALAQLAGLDGARVAWLSADRYDDDPAVLVHDLAGAIDRVAPFDPTTLAAIAVPGGSLWSSAVPRLIARLSAEPGLRLVIDDVDRIERPESVDILVAVAEAAREPATILLGGRTVGRLPVARLVSRRLVTILDRDVLAMDAAETAELLLATGLRSEPEAASDLARSAEGWPAGIYLSAIASARQGLGSGPGSVVAPERLVEDYLRSEVLDVLAPEDRDLVLAAAALDRFSGALCDAMLERTGSGASLDRLERENRFIIALDEERTWYRFHHLLQEFLAAEGERRDPSATREHRRRAAKWHARHGLPDVAVEYAIAADDEPLAADLTVTVGQVAANAGRADTVRRWLEWFDERTAATRRPRLAAYAIMLFALEGDAARAERWANAVKGASASKPDAGVLAISRVVLARDGLDALIADAEMAVDEVPSGDSWRVAALGSLGLARYLSGEPDGGDHWSELAVAQWSQTGIAHSAVTIALIHLTASALARGDRATAEEHLRRARGIVNANSLTERLITIGIDALEARVAMAHGAAEQARARLAHAQRIRPRLGRATPWFSLRARLDLIRVHLALGDGGGARVLLAEIDDILRLRPEMGALLDERAELADRIAAVRGGEAGASTLTMAELRVLPLLTTHLTFREIGERLFVSQNTVKTQAISIYRKLDATSRSEAIERAIDLGLIDSAQSVDRFIPAG